MCSSDLGVPDNIHTLSGIRNRDSGCVVIFGLDYGRMLCRYSVYPAVFTHNRLYAVIVEGIVIYTEIMDICIYGGIVLLVAPYVVENGIELCRSEGHAAGGFGRFSAVDENCHIVRSDQWRRQLKAVSCCMRSL